MRALSIVMYAAAGFLTTVHFLNRKEGYHPVAVVLRNTFFWLRHGLVEEIPSLEMRSWEHGLCLWHHGYTVAFRKRCSPVSSKALAPHYWCPGSSPGSCYRSCCVPSSDRMRRSLFVSADQDSAILVGCRTFALPLCPPFYACLDGTRLSLHAASVMSSRPPLVHCPICTIYV